MEKGSSTTPKGACMKVSGKTIKCMGMEPCTILMEKLPMKANGFWISLMASAKSTIRRRTNSMDPTITPISKILKNIGLSMKENLCLIGDTGKGKSNSPMEKCLLDNSIMISLKEKGSTINSMAKLYLGTGTTTN